MDRFTIDITGQIQTYILELKGFMKTDTILGIKITNSTIDEICKDVLSAVKKKKKMFITSVNPEILISAIENNEMKTILNSATHSLPDGIGIIYASKCLGGNVRSRIAGIDCAEAICKIAANNNFNVFLYGAKKGVAEKAKTNLEKKYPNLNIVGVINGYEKDNSKIVNTINDKNANIVFVALGGGKQEKWIYDNINKVNAQVFQCIGGSLDVFSGNSKRAPKLMQKLGLEWFFRLIKEPSRFKRQAKIPKFIYLVFKEKKSKNQ